MSRYQVSVVVCTYNSECNETKRTLLSIMKQENISYEIIIADDGSLNNNFEKIESFFREYNFSDYKFCKNDKNRGTCINFYNGVTSAEGEYIKAISPQDYLYDSEALMRWYSYAKKIDAKVLFGNAVYYQNSMNGYKICSQKNTQPALNECYRFDSYNYKSALIGNIVLNDCILGAAYLCDRELLLQYLPKIINKIKLCEDFVYRLMLLDGINIYWMDDPMVYYRFGTGVSSKKKSDGTSILNSDEKAFARLLANMNYKSNIKRRIVLFYRLNINNRYVNRLVSFLYIPESVVLLLKKYVKIHIGRARMHASVDDRFLGSIGIEINNS